jgi:hypothetical protein
MNRFLCFAALVFASIFGTAMAQNQVLPNGALPGLPMSLLPPLPTSADNLRLIMPTRTCGQGLRYSGNTYRVSMSGNHLTITLGAQVPSGLVVIGNACLSVPGEEIDLGRLPAGNYTMSVVDPTPQSGKPTFSNVGFSVSDSRVAKNSPFVRLDYSGHW